MKLTDAVYEKMLESELFGEPVKLNGLIGSNGIKARLSSLQSTVAHVSKTRFDGTQFRTYSDKGDTYVTASDVTLDGELSVKSGTILHDIYEIMKPMVDNGLIESDVSSLIGSRLSYQTLRVYVSRLRKDFFIDHSFSTSVRDGQTMIIRKEQS